MDFSLFDQRPIVVAIAGPNGAGKTTFFHSHLQRAALPFINADVLSRELKIDAYAAADIADALRREFVHRSESFVFETVFSDPIGDKLAFLKQVADSNYTVVVCYIGISDAETSKQRVDMRVSQGGHGVPTDKLESRFPRTLNNLRSAIRNLPHILIYDNDDLNMPFRRAAVFENGLLQTPDDLLPAWLRPLIP